MSYTTQALAAIETARNPPRPPVVAQVAERFAAANAALAQHRRELTPKQKLCAELFVLSGSKVQAYREAYDVSERASSWHKAAACDVLDLPHVIDYIDSLQLAAAQGVMVDVQELIASDLAIVKAAKHATNVTWHEWHNCRYCHGKDHLYQYIDVNEFMSVLAQWMDDNATREARKLGLLPEPSDEGGYGFKPSDEPCITCKHCEGRGIQHTMVADTSKLGPASPLYKGVKITKNGIEVILHDVDKAKERLYRATGSFGDDAASVARGAAAGAAAGGAAAAALAARVETMTADEARKAYLGLVG